jgi:hypothetical protein
VVFRHNDEETGLVELSLELFEDGCAFVVEGDETLPEGESKRICLSVAELGVLGKMISEALAYQFPGSLVDELLSKEAGNVR